MRHKAMAALAGVAALAAGAMAARSGGAAIVIQPYVAAAVADTTRPAADTALDTARRPAETLTFVGLKPGGKIVDVFAGPYFDRLFSDVVGPKGKVYMFIPAEVVKIKEAPAIPNGSAPFKDHPNVIALTAPINAFAVPEPVDVVWIRQNYHDLYDKFMGPADVPAFDRAVFKALKRGGHFIVLDHAAPAGSGIGSTDTAHRIDPARVKADLAAAGFVFVGESRMLANPADDHSKLVFDPAIRGHTDQFLYKFKKP